MNTDNTIAHPPSWPAYSNAHDWVKQPTPAEALLLADCDNIEQLLAVAADIRDQGYGDVVSYSRKVFIPLTRLCRDACHYCTFAQPPRRGQAAYLTPDEVLEIARAGQRAGCHEALFTLGDKPELRYRVARDELARLGHDSTLSYLGAMAEAVLDETGLLPHLNPGVMARGEIERLRGVSASMGIMLESAAERLSNAADRITARPTSGLRCGWRRSRRRARRRCRSPRAC